MSSRVWINERSPRLTMFRKWLDKLLGRSSDAGRAEEARTETAIERQRLDRAADRVMGVGGDYGSTLPRARAPEDHRPD
jgi:hypothetical protein